MKKGGISLQPSSNEIQGVEGEAFLNQLISTGK
jgi:hypothetical protein